MTVNYDPFFGAREVEPAYSAEDDMVRAFIRACKQKQSPDFSRSLRSWAEWRRRAKLAVDPWDSEADKPSDEFKASLRKAFEKTFPKPAKKKSVEKTTKKKRR